MIPDPRREATPRPDIPDIGVDDALDAVFYTSLILGRAMSEIQGMVFVAVLHGGASGNRQLADLAVELAEMQRRLESIVGRLPAALHADDDG
jgi:hypothetical protein